MFGAFANRKSFILAGIVGIAAIGAYSVVPAFAQQEPNEGKKQEPGNKPWPGQPGERGERQRGGISLEGAMKLMGRSFDTIAKNIDDPTKDEITLKAISSFESGAAASKGLVAPLVEKKTGDEKKAAAAEFRGMLMNLLKEAIVMEEALLAGKRDEAKASLEKIHEMEEKGHAKFAPDEK